MGRIGVVAITSVSIRLHAVDARAAQSSQADLNISTAWADAARAIAAFVMLAAGMVRDCRGKW